jgi:hypothetical protein
MRGTCLKLMNTVTVSVVKVHVVEISECGTVRITEFYTKKLDFLLG